MVFSAVLTVNMFNGLNTNVWTGWVFFAVALGNVLLWCYIVSKRPEIACNKRSSYLLQGRL